MASSKSVSSIRTSEEMTDQGTILNRQEQLKPILKVSEATIRTIKTTKRVMFVNCDGDDSDEDFEVEFSNECSVETVVNKISALTFSQIGQQDRGQKYVLNRHLRKW
jgi:hypothetical protein